MEEATQEIPENKSLGASKELILSTYCISHQDKPHLIFKAFYSTWDPLDCISNNLCITTER